MFVPTNGSGARMAIMLAFTVASRMAKPIVACVVNHSHRYKYSTRQPQPPPRRHLTSRLSMKVLEGQRIIGIMFALLFIGAIEFTSVTLLLQDRSLMSVAL